MRIWLKLAVGYYGGVGTSQNSNDSDFFWHRDWRDRRIWGGPWTDNKHVKLRDFKPIYRRRIHRIEHPIFEKDSEKVKFAESCIASGRPMADLQQYSRAISNVKFAQRMDQELGAGHYVKYSHKNWYIRRGQRNSMTLIDVSSDLAIIAWCWYREMLEIPFGMLKICLRSVKQKVR